MRGIAFVAALWALPSSAQLLELHRSLPPPPPLPERPAFEELLLSFADPERALRDGFTVPSLSLAVRSRAWAFVRSGPGAYEEKEAWGALSLPAQDLAVSELPGGRRLVSLLKLGSEVEQLRMRDLGPWLRGPTGPLQGLLHSTLDKLPVSRTGAEIAGGVVALGLLYQFGTERATSLGLSPVLHGTVLKGSLSGSVELRSEPHLKNARADMVAGYRLPPTLRLLTGPIEQLEVGVTAARTPEGLLLDSRWANLRGRVAWLEMRVGIRSNHAEPNPWLDVETLVQREHFGLRAMFGRQWVTADVRSMATATLRTGPVLSGLFVGVQQKGRAFGLISMGNF